MGDEGIEGSGVNEQGVGSKGRIKLAKAVMFLGTGSDVGNSIATAAFGRIFKGRGYKVAPFKVQNMSNNSYVTIEEGEIGRAQVVEAEAAGVLPSVRMNPVLLKPSSDQGSQVVLQGRSSERWMPWTTISSSHA
nr:hypothetical protein [Desulfobacterales bacterium]